MKRKLKGAEPLNPKYSTRNSTTCVEPNLQVEHQAQVKLYIREGYQLSHYSQNYKHIKDNGRSIIYPTNLSLARPPYSHKQNKKTDIGRNIEVNVSVSASKGRSPTRG